MRIRLATLMLNGKMAKYVHNCVLDVAKMMYEHLTCRVESKSERKRAISCEGRCCDSADLLYGCLVVGCWHNVSAMIFLISIMQKHITIPAGSP